ncbi:MAG: septum formation protein Maf [Rhodospirillales bacterium]|nr:septum formation protein Maf [Rhodospirillales bacterium]|tara:strand:+ start:5783 stop:6379 length:597 start_codon:yes stop_codon:yes gene_type:complete
MSKVVLASSSFTRKKILEDAGLVFSVEVPNVDEQELKGALLFKGASGEDIAGFLAEHKSCIVSTRVPSALVIGADQVLECEGIIYSKPKNLVAAKEQLNTLRGKKHTLISSVVVAEGGKRIWEHTDRSLLHMRKFSDCFLDEYISKQGKSLLDSPGCYQVESAGIQLFTSIEGNHFTILGLPLLPVLHYLRLRGAIAA